MIGFAENWLAVSYPDEIEWACGKGISKEKALQSSVGNRKNMQY